MVEARPEAAAAPATRGSACRPPRSRGQLTSQLERPLVAVDVDHHPAGDQVLGLRERTVGDRRPPLAVVADERALRRECLPVDELAGLLEPRGEVAHVLDVGRHLVGRPLVHRHVVDRRRRAPVVLEQQVLGHHVLLRCGTARVAVFTAGTEASAGSRHPRATSSARIFGDATRSEAGSGPATDRWLICSAMVRTRWSRPATCARKRSSYVFMPTTAHPTSTGTSSGAEPHCRTPVKMNGEFLVISTHSVLYFAPAAASPGIRRRSAIAACIQGRLLLHLRVHADLRVRQRPEPGRAARFYWRRFLSVGIPYLCWSVIYFLHSLPASHYGQVRAAGRDDQLPALPGRRLRCRLPPRPGARVGMLARALVTVAIVFAFGMALTSFLARTPLAVPLIGVYPGALAAPEVPRQAHPAALDNGVSQVKPLGTSDAGRQLCCWPDHGSHSRAAGSRPWPGRSGCPSGCHGPGVCSPS